jgi:hypothetical protein
MCAKETVVFLTAEIRVLEISKRQKSEMQEDFTMTATVVIEFRGEQAAIVYTGYPVGLGDRDELVFWFEDERPWPEDLTDAEVGALCEEIKRHAAAARGRLH